MPKLSAILVFVFALGCATPMPVRGQAMQPGTAIVSWVEPTQNVDNSTVVPGEITGERVDWSVCAGTDPTTYTMGAHIGSSTQPAGTTSYTVTGLAMNLPGPTCFTVTTLATITYFDPALDVNVTADVTSDPSVVVYKQIRAPLPAPAKARAPSAVKVK
jgi:hypothetical protein